jgi:ribosomal protein S18 acetylase RimI-like enzyme
MRLTIRPASPGDGAAIQEIERSAGARFRDVGLPEVADYEPDSIEVLAGYARDGRSWVAVDEADEPIGYVLADVVDGNAHIEQVSVHPGSQGAGVGRALTEQVRAWGAAVHLPAMTLTTFTDVPWNAPLYEHLGFRVLAEDEIGPELRTLRDMEATHGLDPMRRVCMRLDISA